MHSIITIFRCSTSAYKLRNGVYKVHNHYFYAYLTKRKNDLCKMHINEFPFEDTFDENVTKLEDNVNSKEYSNKGFSFPQYILKYKGFVPADDKDTILPIITSKDVHRVIGLDSERINNYFMEFNKFHYTPIRLYDSKVLERICDYYSQQPDQSNIEKEEDGKENHKNSRTNIEKPPEKETSPTRESKTITKCDLVEKDERSCHCKLMKNDKSLFLKTVDVFYYMQVDLQYKIYIGEVQSGRDKRTTCMIKNIPNKYTQKMLIDLLNEHHFGCYDFVYLRMDFKNKCNVGYAFVNLIDSLCVGSLYKKVNNKGWKKFSSNKIAQLTYASIQGLDNLKRKFRKSSVMQEQESFRPKIFYSDGPLKGYERPEF